MKRFVLLALLTLTVTIVAALPAGAAALAQDTETYQELPRPGKKVPLGADHYFTFDFDKKPKMGKAILRVDIFTSDGQRDRSFVVMGDADMPSMRGAHSSGNKEFALSSKGIYLLPLQFVMPGDWEIRLIFERNGATVLRGVYLFDL